MQPIKIDPNRVEREYANDMDSEYEIMKFDVFIVSGSWRYGRFSWGIWLGGTWYYGVWLDDTKIYSPGSSYGIPTVWISGIWEKGKILKNNGKLKSSKVSPKSFKKPKSTLSLNNATYS